MRQIVRRLLYYTENGACRHQTRGQLSRCSFGQLRKRLRFFALALSTCLPCLFLCYLFPFDHYVKEKNVFILCRDQFTASIDVVGSVDPMIWDDDRIHVLVVSIGSVDPIRCGMAYGICKGCHDNARLQVSAYLLVGAIFTCCGLPCVCRCRGLFYRLVSSDILEMRNRKIRPPGV